VVLSETDITKLRASLASKRYATGTSTHDFYHYPARFSPEIARAVIETCSSLEDWVLDPFMGGGTTVIEGLALRRRVIGVDINSLAHFVASVRTRPLSKNDRQQLLSWAELVAAQYCKNVSDVERSQVLNLPKSVDLFISGALDLAPRLLTKPRRHAFARCALLRLGQWALDCRDFSAPTVRRLAERLPALVAEMLAGMDEFVTACRASGVSIKNLTKRRVLLNRSAVGVAGDPALARIRVRPRLVFTSPPYAGVHVLYHRWQYRGRKETAAPYWIADVQDGAGASYYTAGSRTPTGLKNYFNTIVSAFKSVRAVIDPEGLVVQLVGFSRTSEQLPQYLEAMSQAGFAEYEGMPEGGFGRRVPNRKWYARVRAAGDASSEVLLIHRPV